jgi:hypothetical protein
MADEIVIVYDVAEIAWGFNEVVVFTVVKGIVEYFITV